MRRSERTRKKISLPVARETAKLKKLENSVQNMSFESIVSARPAATPRNRGEKRRSRDNDYMMNQPSSYSADSLTTPSCHGHSFPCSSSVPNNNCHHISWFWDLLYSLFRLGLGTEMNFWSQFHIYLTGEFSSFFGH